ncbi:MAG: hypothetical protein HQ558_00350 [Candidatus Omnitrophica bacterium]|nr:hypothetical protein [Candidatus Omnitrophota bacterium]
MKVRYKILIGVAILLVLSYASISYLNRTFIPVRLKHFLVKNLEEQLQRDVEIDKLQFSITKGFILTNTRIYEDTVKNDKYLFKADEISFGIIFIPSIKNYHLIIPHLNLKGPYLNLQRSETGDWNIPPSLLGKKEKKASRFRIIVKAVTFDSGGVDFRDQYQKRHFQKSLIGLKGSAGLSFPDLLTLDCSGNIDKALIKIGSRFHPVQKQLSIELEADNLALADYCNAYFKDRIGLYSGICGGRIKAEVINFQDAKVRGSLNLQDLNADIRDMAISGNYTLEGSAKLDLKDFSIAGYDLKLGAEGAKVTTTKKAFKEIGNIYGLISLSDENWSTKKLSCSIYGSPSIITGNVTRPDKDFIINAEISSDMALKNIADAVNMDIESGDAKIKTRVTYRKDGTFNISARSQIADLTLFQKDTIISGDFIINGDSSGTAGDWESLQYKGVIDFANVKIEGVESLPLISDASGEAAFDTKRMTIKNLTGTAADSTIRLSGDIGYKAKEPAINMRLVADNLSLAKFLSSLPEEIGARFSGIEADGLCSLDLKFNGTGKKLEAFDYEGRLLLKGCSVNMPHWPKKITDIDCDVQFTKDEILWRDLNLDIRGTKYHSYGKLIDFKKPKISITLESEYTKAIAEIEIEDKIISILKCKGSYRGSSFSANGKISNIKNPYAVIAGSVNLDMKDTPHIFTSQKDRLTRLKPAGAVRVKFDMSGPLKDFPEWRLSLEATSESIYICGLKLKDLYIDLRMKDRFIDIPVAAAYPYNGVVNIDARINLNTKDKPYIINIDVKDIDLRQLVEDTELEEKKIKGAFGGQVVLNGYLGQKDSLKGRGWLQIADGYLWEFPVMRGMVEIVFGMPPEYITLTDAFGNFALENNRIYTEDFKMLSKVASLLWVGSLGFDGTLDFNITGRFAEDIAKQTTQPGKIASAILREAGDLIMEIRLGGTLAKPKYQIIPFPVKRILREKVVDKIKDIFGNIGE